MDYLFSVVLYDLEYMLKDVNLDKIVSKRSQRGYCAISLSTLNDKSYVSVLMFYNYYYRNSYDVITNFAWFPYVSKFSSK